MKSIRQQLQSRISKRRNWINQVEGIRQQLREQVKVLDSLDFDVEDQVQQLKGAKMALKDLHSDQKLDKKLYAMLVDNDRYEAQWSEFWDTVQKFEVQVSV